MKKSVAMKQELETMKNEMEKLLNNRNVKEARKKKEEIVALKEAIKFQEELEVDEENRILNIVKEKKKEEEIVDKRSFTRARDFKNSSTFYNHFFNDKDDDFSKDNKPLTVKDFARGILFNEWQNGKAPFKTKADGSVLIPIEVLSEIVYEASQKSVLLGNCPMYPMNSTTTLVGRVKENVSLDFKAKFEEGHQSDFDVEALSLEAKTLYAYIEIAEEDLQDIVNLEEIFRNAFSGAVAKTIDENFLYTNPKSSEKEGVYPKGILDNPNIKKIEVDTVDFDMIGKACLEISKANGSADTVGLNPYEYYKLHMLKDSTGQYIVPPNFYNDKLSIESNGVKNNTAVVFDSNQVLIGLRRDMDIKLMPQLKYGTVLLRCMLRADVLPLREEHICKITINE